MPLLMIGEAQGKPRGTSTVDVEPGIASAISVGVGQLLVVESVDPGQVAALFAFTDADTGEFLSPHHTRVFGGSFILRMGTRMVTNRRRPMFVVGRDSLREHDLLLPASDQSRLTAVAAATEASLRIAKLPDPVNLFANVRLSGDGRLTVGPGRARAGERITFRVLIDATIVVASVVLTQPEASGAPMGRVRVTTHDDVRDLPVDLPLRDPA